LLIHGLLEPVVTLLDIPVLVALPGLDRLPFEAIVPQQCLIPLGELRAGCPRWNRGGEPIRAVNRRHATQLREGVLQSVGQRLE